MRGAIVLLLVLILAGCRQPIRVVTDNRLVSDNRVHMPPTDQSSRLLPAPVDGSAGNCPLRIAIIDVDGLMLNMNLTGLSSLGENPLALFREKLDAVAADCAVRGVVLRINSPGGSVAATDAMWRDLQAFRAHTRLPVVACLMDYGAGGGYYLATASDSIIAHPSTVTGGIGVILNLYNLREFMASLSIAPQEIKAGKNIDMGSSARSLAADDEKEKKQMLQNIANDFHQQFIRVVRAARPAVADAPSTFDGRIFSAQQALDLRLIDNIGYLDDAIRAARTLGNCECAQVVLYRRANDLVNSRYAITPNTPLQNTILPNIPGLERTRLPTFLYMWQPEITLEKMSGR